MAEEPTNHNEAGEIAPSTVDKQAPSVSEEHAPSTDEAVATDIPTANAPDPDANLVENPEAAEEKGTPVVEGTDQSALNPKTDGRPADRKTAAPPKQDKPAAKAKGDKPAAKAAGDKPAAKAAKKEKAPAVEDKPFAEFMQQDYLPAVKKALEDQGVQELELTFAKQKVPIAGLNQDEYWQVIGRWQNGLRQFNIYFPDEDIQGKRAFSCNEGSKPSTLEPFLIDERKITLDLMIYGLVQRLNGQKWLSLN
jgi:hypothetical protein